MVSIPGGEPLIHPEIDKIVEGLVARKKYVYLCTANLEWAGAVAQAIQEAMNYSRSPRSGGQGGEFIYLDQERLRN